MATPALLAPLTRQQFFNNNGNPLVGGYVWTYQAGTSTPTATFTDYTGNTQNPNPILLDSRGSCAIWLTPNTSIKINLTDSLGNQIPGYPVDQVGTYELLSLYGGVDVGTVNNYILNFTASFNSYVNGTVIYWVASNSNTSNSTLNVNSLGVTPILNLNGTQLGANQILANQITQVIFYAGNFYLNTIGAYVGINIGTFGPETALVSATTTDLGSASAHVVKVTGTTTITSFGSSASLQAPIYVVRFAGALTLTYNAASLIIPGGITIVTAPGDACIAQYLGSGNWKILIYQGVVAGAASFTATLTGMGSPTTGTVHYIITGSPGGGYVATLSTNGVAITGPSNAGTMTMTGLPAAVTPSWNVTVTSIFVDASNAQGLGIATIGSNSVITFGLFEVSGVSLPVIGFTGSGTKGLDTDWTITYPL